MNVLYAQLPHAVEINLTAGSTVILLDHTEMEMAKGLLLWLMDLDENCFTAFYEVYQSIGKVEKPN